VNDYLISVLLGIVEGLTEFLPISSTAHLRIAQDWLGISLEDGYWKTYSVVIQLGAILSVVWYFRGRLAGFVRSFPRGADGASTWLTHPLSLVMIAFAVTAGPSYLLDKKIGENLENLYVIGGALIVGGVVMWVVDVLCRNPRTMDMAGMTLAQALWIGAAQILSAAFPGTSRSMATIAAGQVVGLSRPAALEFSFFLSIPVMFAATGLKLAQAVFGHADASGTPLHLTGRQWVVLLIGFVVSFIVALLTVHWLMAWVRRRGFVPFAVYRIVIGMVVIAMALRDG
jgi:undecaprenyl-diphosphatase